MKLPFIRTKRNHTKKGGDTLKQVRRILAKGRSDAELAAPHIDTAWVTTGKKQLEQHLKRLPPSELPNDPIEKGQYLNKIHLRVRDTYFAYATALVMQTAFDTCDELAATAGDEEMHNRATAVRQAVEIQRQFLTSHGIDAEALDRQFRPHQAQTDS